MVQKATFSNGGFVLHKIPTVTGGTVMSCWYDNRGQLLDSERRDGRNLSREDRSKATLLGAIWK